MIQVQLKLRIKPKQKVILNEWLLVLTRVWNWAIRKIELDGKDGIYYSKKEFQNLLVNHGKKLEIPFRRPDGVHIKIPGLGILRFHKQDVPEGKIKCGRIVRRASGWYLCLFIEGETKTIPLRSNCVVGIDPGYTSTLTLSSGEKIDKPKQLQRTEKRLAQAQRGKRKQLTARLQERIKNRRKDNIKGIAKSYRKSVAEASHYQLRQMLSYKFIASGRKYIKADSKGSTMTCCNCLAKTALERKQGCR